MHRGNEFLQLENPLCVFTPYAPEHIINSQVLNLHHIIIQVLKDNKTTVLTTTEVITPEDFPSAYFHITETLKSQSNTEFWYQFPKISFKQNVVMRSIIPDGGNFRRMLRPSNSNPLSFRWEIKINNKNFGSIFLLPIQTITTQRFAIKNRRPKVRYEYVIFAIDNPTKKIQGSSDIMKPELETIWSIYSPKKDIFGPETQQEISQLLSKTFTAWLA